MTGRAHANNEKYDTGVPANAPVSIYIYIYIYICIYIYIYVPYVSVLKRRGMALILCP